MFGVHPVREALIARRRTVDRVIVARRRKGRIGDLPTLARQRQVPVEYVGDEYFNSRLRDCVHQGVAGEVGDLPVVDKEVVLERARREDRAPFLLALDGVVDPQNLGSMIRSARGLGVHGVLLPKVRSAPLSAAASKASAGAMEQMHFVRVANMVSALEGLKKEGCWVVGAVAREGTAVNDVDLTVGLVLVVGGEEKGIRPLVRKTCDFLVSIPQDTGLDSLNAAVAGAIVMYEIGRQRREAKG